MDTVVSIEAARGERDDAWGLTREDAAALLVARTFLAYQRAAAVRAGDDELEALWAACEQAKGAYHAAVRGLAG